MTLIHRANTTNADVISNISAYRFDNITDAFGGFANNTVSGPNWGQTLFGIVNVYPDFMGQVAWFIIFLIPFAMMWVGHADVVPASIVGIFFGLYVFAYIGDDLAWVGILMMMVGLGTVIWSLWQRRV